jgi:uncharacterized membrane protein affecting hemolysin expression
MPVAADGPVTKADIETKLRQIRGEVDETAEHSRSYLMMAAVVGVVAAIGLAFLFGKRKGKRKSTVVEIRRV